MMRVTFGLALFISSVALGASSFYLSIGALVAVIGICGAASHYWAIYILRAKPNYVLLDPLAWAYVVVGGLLGIIFVWSSAIDYGAPISSVILMPGLTFLATFGGAEFLRGVTGR